MAEQLSVHLSTSEYKYVTNKYVSTENAVT
jgi:hypothetical protein